MSNLKILRILDLGHRVKMIESKCDSIAVDFPKDVLRVEEFLEKNNIN